MATPLKTRSVSSSSLLLVSFSLLLLLLLSRSCNAEKIPRKIFEEPLKVCKFDAIYQLGDSLVDTGNLIRESPFGFGSRFARLPYGKTRYSLFKNSTGRTSDGLIMLDFIAKATGLPFLEPYLDGDARFRHGVNFAVAGASALSAHALAKHNIGSPLTNSSLVVQLNWIRSHFNKTCQNHIDCIKKHESALFIVGAFGANDYNNALLGGKTVEEVMSIVPEVIKIIKYAIKIIIDTGARKVVVPGNFPFGCVPIYLTVLQTNDSNAYDELHCLKGLNNMTTYHNDLLRQAIKELRQQNPNVIIIYGDYYNAFLFMYRFALAPGNGFDTTSLNKACCGIGGDYNFNLTRICGSPDVPACAYPDELVSWDGIHLTERAYFVMTSWIVSDILPQLRCV